jgi:hypothetical protein
MIFALRDQLVERLRRGVDLFDVLADRLNADTLDRDVVVRVVGDLDEVLQLAPDLLRDRAVVDARADFDVPPGSAGEGALVQDRRRRRARGEKEGEQQCVFHKVQEPMLHRLLPVTRFAELYG